jgi:hypothetical protein
MGARTSEHNSSCAGGIGILSAEDRCARDCPNLPGPPRVSKFDQLSASAECRARVTRMNLRREHADSGELCGYLKAHHPAVSERIIAAETVELPALTVPR